jgi:CRISPR-associated exonuclease Cas4
MHSEDNLVMLSALQHFLFCPRQCALIHVEQLWAENRLTAEGRILHERVHTAARESRRKIRVEYDMPIRSVALGLTGRADVVEFHLREDGSWQPYPVEYKRGRPKKHDADMVQLCAQVLCLEEMLNTHIPEALLYYGKKRRRFPVEMSVTLRNKTVETAGAVHEMLDSGKTPAPQYGKHCGKCSLFDLCLPGTVGRPGKVAGYMQKMVEEE